MSSDRTGSDSHVKTLWAVAGAATPVSELLPPRAPWVVLVVVLPPDEMLPVPSVSSQCGHSVRESTEAALPGWANGKPAVKQALWNL